MANTVEELEAQKAAQEEAAQQQIEEAGQVAQAAAEAQGLSEEEVNKRVEAARREEKDKLYGKIEDLTGRVKELQEHIRNEQAEKEEKERKQAEEAERRRIAKLSDEQKQTEILERIEEQLRAERKAREDLESSLSRKEREEQLAKYRESALRAAGPRIIPELVYGNSEAEIDAAVTRAKARFEEIDKQAREAHGQHVKHSMSGTSTSPGYEALEEQELEERLPNIAGDKYAKMSEEDRERIKDQIASEYQRAMGR